jgi:hypothetical protein
MQMAGNNQSQTYPHQSVSSFPLSHSHILTSCYFPLDCLYQLVLSCLNPFLLPPNPETYPVGNLNPNPSKPLIESCRHRVPTGGKPPDPLGPLRGLWVEGSFREAEQRFLLLFLEKEE